MIVTLVFRSIQELQEQNQKLLIVIRDLSEKREREETEFTDARSENRNNYVPPTEGVGHIVFGADPVGVRVRVASFRHDIF